MEIELFLDFHFPSQYSLLFLHIGLRSVETYRSFMKRLLGLQVVQATLSRHLWKK